MDCWSLSLPLDDEFEKLVNRMNPPRSVLLSILSLIAQSDHGFADSVPFSNWVSFFRVTIDNDSSTKATLIKVLFASIFSLIFRWGIRVFDRFEFGGFFLFFLFSG